MIRALFMGTPAAAVPSLSALAGVADIVGVVTQPDSARGRGRHKGAPAVKTAAEEWGFPVAQPDDETSLLETISAADFDIGVVVAYGRLLRPAALAASPYGYLNVHFSLLPRWRGAAPVERAILAGDDHTGVAIMQLEEGLDTGPVIAVREAEITATDTGGTLTARLAHLGADLLIDSLDDFVSGRRVPAPQMAGLATMAPQLTTAEAQLHGAMPVETAELMVRGFNPRPGAWMIVGEDRLKVFAAAHSDAAIPPGVLEFRDERPVVGFQGGSLELVQVQPAGQRSMAGAEWGNGRRQEPGVVALPTT